MSSTHLYQILYLHKNQLLDVHCKPNDRFLYNTDSKMEWQEMIYSNKISSKEIHQQNDLLKVGHITQKEEF